MIVKKRDTEREFTVSDYLLNKVKFGMPEKALLALLVDRELIPDMPFADADKKTLRLCYADMLKWFLLGASKENNTTDSDNGWAHTSGGYELDDDDKAELKSEANAIYRELEPESEMKRKSVFRMQSHGVKRANTDIYGNLLPHYNK